MQGQLTLESPDKYCLNGCLNGNGEKMVIYSGGLCIECFKVKKEKEKKIVPDNLNFEEFIMRDDLHEWIFVEDKEGNRLRERIISQIEKFGVEKWFKVKGYPTDRKSIWKNRHTAHLIPLEEKIFAVENKPSNSDNFEAQGYYLWENWLPLSLWNEKAEKDLMSEYRKGTPQYHERIRQEELDAKKQKKYEAKKKKVEEDEDIEFPDDYDENAGEDYETEQNEQIPQIQQYTEKHLIRWKEFIEKLCAEKNEKVEVWFDLSAPYDNEVNVRLVNHNCSWNCVAFRFNHGKLTAYDSNFGGGTSFLWNLEAEKQEEEIRKVMERVFNKECETNRYNLDSEGKPHQRHIFNIGEDFWEIGDLWKEEDRELLKAGLKNGKLTKEQKVVKSQIELKYKKLREAKDKKEKELENITGKKHESFVDVLNHFDGNKEKADEYANNQKEVVKGIIEEGIDVERMDFKVGLMGTPLQKQELTSNVEHKMPKNQIGSSYSSGGDIGNTNEEIMAHFIDFYKNILQEPYYPEKNHFTTTLKIENVNIIFSESAKVFLTKQGFDFNKLDEEIKKLKATQRNATQEEIAKGKTFEIMEKTMSKIRDECYAIRGYFGSLFDKHNKSYNSREHYEKKMKELGLDTADLNKLKEIYESKAKIYKVYYLRVYEMRHGQKGDEQYANV